MTSNNLEAIELLKNCVGRLQEQGFLNFGNTLNELNKAIDLLRADRAESSSEDIDVKEKPILGCSRCDWTSESAHPHSSHTPQPDHDWCKECTHSYKKPTKETKLRELKIQVSNTLASPVSNDELIRIVHRLLDILLEEEY